MIKMSEGLKMKKRVWICSIAAVTAVTAVAVIGIVVHKRRQ